MKLKKVFLVLSIILNSSTYASSVGELFVTSTGARFVYVNDATLGLAWKSQDGRLWGPAIGFYKHMQALAACKAVGGVVPTLEDYQVLHGYFEKKPGTRSLSSRGFEELFTLFPDLKKYNYFWTSTLVPGDPSIAFIFDGVYGTVGSAVCERYLGVYTQCMSYPRNQNK